MFGWSPRGSVLLLVALVGGAADGGSPTSSLRAFRFQPKRIVVGDVAHYTKSNLDGSKPARVSIFVAAPDRIEVAKVEKGVVDAAFVRAHFDWTLFSADHLDAGVIDLDGTREERG